MSDHFDFHIPAARLTVDGDEATLAAFVKDEWRETRLTRRVWRLMAILSDEHRGTYEFPYGVVLEVSDEQVAVMAEQILGFTIEDFRQVSHAYLAWDKCDSLAPIVRRAITDTVIAIGQLAADEERALKSAVERGLLGSYKDGPFLAPKTVYYYSVFAE